MLFFAWIYEERNPIGLQKLPFVPYPYQETELAVIHQSVLAGVGVGGSKQIKLWLKSRDMGLTWLILVYYLWDWLFNRGIFHIGSFAEKEVDYLNDPGTLFFKLRFLIKNLPEWMKPADLEDKKLLLAYHNGEVAITGQAAVEDFGRGKRKKAILMDEFAKWEHDRTAYRSVIATSNVVHLVGTPFGYGNYYSEIARGKAKVKAEIRRVHWTVHPLKNQDLEYIDGHPTSSWYRKECAGMETDMIAGELDLSFESSIKGLVFAAHYGNSHEKKGLKPIPGVPIIRAWDPGGWAACIFLQVDKYRRVRVYREVIEHGKTIHEFAEIVKAVSQDFISRGFTIKDQGAPMEWFTFEDCGDSSGGVITKMNQEEPEFETLRAHHDIDVDYTFMAGLPTQLKRKARVTAITNLLVRHIASGIPENDGPAIWIDVDKCPILDEALKGGYRRKLDRNNNVLDVIDDTKRPYTDAVDALGYGVLYKLGIPESIRKEMTKRSEEEQEDNESSSDGCKPLRQSRC